MVSVPVGADAGAAVSDDGALASDAGAVGAAASVAGAASLVLAGSSREEQATRLSAQTVNATNLDAIAGLRTPARPALLHHSRRAQRLFSRFTKAPGSASCAPSARLACSNSTSASSANSSGLSRFSRYFTRWWSTLISS